MIASSCGEVPVVSRSIATKESSPMWAVPPFLLLVLFV
jgi:hypothetical protein